MWSELVQEERMQRMGWDRGRWPPLKGTSWRNRRKILECHNNDLFCKWEHLPQYLRCIFLKGQAAIFRCSRAQYVKRGKEKLEPHLVVLLSPLPLCPLPSLVCISTNTNADQGRCGRIMLQACECRVKELDMLMFTNIMLDITLKPSVSRSITCHVTKGTAISGGRASNTEFCHHKEDLYFSFIYPKSLKMKQTKTTDKEVF